MYMKERSMRERDQSSYPQRRRTPSFSSTLLESIYRSTDESKSSLDENQELGVSKQSNFSYKQSNLSCKQGVYMEKGGKVRMNLRRAVMMEDWMEKQSSLYTNSTSSSSECSSGGAAFSSSETETSFQKLRHKLKSERTQKHEKPQKMKQPISPRSRIASFLSSIFNSGNVKKAKMCYVGAVEDVSFEQKSKSPCFSSSSASSFSRRSCMSKTPKGKKSSNSGVKRSVRFYPVSVILGETENSHSQPYQNDPNGARKFARSSSIKKLKSCSVMARENRAEAGACGKLNFRGFYDRNIKDVVDDDEEDDALSCSSSDLFELDHLIGAARYKEELPVYETTNLETNKAIANGLHL